MKDESSKECRDCRSTFNLIRRKHHCRGCGEIFCSNCATHTTLPSHYGVQGAVRVCAACRADVKASEVSPEPAASGGRLRSSFRDGSPLAISAPIEASARQPQSQFAASHLYPRRDNPYVPGMPEPDLRILHARRDSVLSIRPPSPREELLDDEPESPNRMLGSPLAFAQPAGRGSPVLAGAGTGTVTAPFRRALAEEDEEAEAGEDQAGEGELEGLGITIGEGTPEFVREGSGVGEHEDDELLLGMDSHELVPPSAPTSPALDHADEDQPLARPPDLHQLHHFQSGEGFPNHLERAPATVHAKPSPGPSRSRVPSFDPALDPAGSAISFPNPNLAHSTAGPDATHLARMLSARTAAPRFVPDLADEAELSDAVWAYVRRMLRQSLELEEVPNPRTWEAQLVRLLVEINQGAGPNVKEGADLDMRKYARIKKIPGGHPRDSEYVAGVVFTKNLMHKAMAREVVNPRVMVFSFGLEYQASTQNDCLVSFDTILAQERASVENIMARVMKFKPHVVLVEGNVSSLALDHLLKDKVSVARHVKSKVIHDVARATGGQVFAGQVSLAGKTRLGRCGRFRVQTFAHSLIPGQRKTIMRFEGCDPSLGCTIILRGGPMDALTKVKEIVDTAILVVYNNRLEASLYRDELLLPPTHLPDDAPSPGQAADEGLLAELDLTEPDRVSRYIARALRPYQNTALSSSAFIRFPPPHPLARISQLDHQLRALRQQRQDEETLLILQGEAEAKRQEAIASMAIASPLLGTNSGMSTSGSSSSLASLTDQSKTSSVSSEPSTVATGLGSRPFKPIENPLRVLHSEEEMLKTSELLELEKRHADYLMRAELFQAKAPPSFNPAAHQKISVLETTASNQHDRICCPGQVRTVEFYGEHDCTLGQFIEKMVRDIGKHCSAPGCGLQMISHFKTWCHGEYRVLINHEAYTTPLEVEADEDQIVMWSVCRDCQQINRNNQENGSMLRAVENTPHVIMSDETYRLSFYKYLELAFYPQGLRRADRWCHHEGHLAQIRMFQRGYINLRVTVDKIVLREIVGPPRTLRVWPVKQLMLRNGEFKAVWDAISCYYASIDKRITAFDPNLVQADRTDEFRLAMDKFAAQSEKEKRAMLHLLEDAYERAPEGATNGTEMTAVRQALQDKSIQWEKDWTALEKRVFPSDKDLRRLTNLQLGKLFPSDKTASPALPSSPERRTSGTILTPSIEEEDKAEKEDQLGELSGLQISVEEPGSSTVTPTSSSSFTEALAALDGAGLSTAAPTECTPGLCPIEAAIEVPGLPAVQMSSTDCESDSTVCAEPVRSGLRMTPYGPDEAGETTSGTEDDSEADSAANSSITLHTPHRRSGSHRSPSTTPGVAELVSFFNESPVPASSGGKLSATSRDKSTGSLSPRLNRPSLRRGATERPRSTIRAHQAAEGAQSDGEGVSSTGYAQNVGLLHLAKSSHFATKQSKLPKKAPGSPSLAAAARGGQKLGDLFAPLSVEEEHARTVTRDRLVVSPVEMRAGSPATSRPSSRAGTRPALPSPRLADATAEPHKAKANPPWGAGPGATKTAGKGKAVKRDGDPTPPSSMRLAKPSSRSRELSIGRPTASSAGRSIASRRVGSGPGMVISGDHVLKIASHFNQKAREAERDSGRRHAPLRGLPRRQARPVITALPTIQVFHNHKDAAKEDSDEDDDEVDESGSSDGADDEYDPEIDMTDAEDKRRGATGVESKPAAVSIVHRHVPSQEMLPQLIDLLQPPPGASTPSEAGTVNPASSMLVALTQAPAALVHQIGRSIPGVEVGDKDSKGRDVDRVEPVSTPASPSFTDAFASFPRLLSEGESSGNERGSVFKALSSLWGYRDAGFSPLADPLHPTEHLFSGNPILVREDEPSSILAFVLSSKPYHDKLDEANQPTPAPAHPPAPPKVVLDGSEPFMPAEDSRNATVTSNWGLLNFDPDRSQDRGSQAGESAGGPEEEPAQATNKAGGITFKLDFGDTTCSFNCKIFFADRFEALRRSCGCDEQFIQSLSRCVKWNSSGGRSKVDFLKTHDDRFIMKEISRAEMESLLIFAPAYFNYMADAIRTNRPTVLAKIFGIYRIGLTNPRNNKKIKLDVLVMENLFYERELAQIFDLKGSTRNRHVQPSGNRPNEVLMDENLVKISYHSPLYVPEESKRFLRQAVFNDSRFLSELNVMDYSLVVGVDKARGELVVGIVDFMRTYTWDKRIETWVKDTALLGGGGAGKPGGPTIVTPRQYEMRFREAMEGYLLVSPDAWWQGGSGVGGDDDCGEKEKERERGREERGPAGAGGRDVERERSPRVGV